MTMEGDQTAESLFSRFWQWRLQDSAEFAAYCGVHDYDDRWDDISQEAQKNRISAVEGFLSDANAIDVSACSKETKLNLKLFIEDMKTFLLGKDVKCHLFPISYLEGIHNDLHHQMGYLQFQTKDDFKKYVSKLKALPERILQIIPLLQQGIEEGVTMHKHSMADVPEQLKTWMTEPVDKSELMEPFSNSAFNLEKDFCQRLKKEAEHEIVTNIQPAFEKLLNFIESEYMEHLRPEEGINSLKNGADWYQRCLDFHLSCSMTPQEVHDLGLKEVARIKEQMLQVAEEEGFGKDLKAFQKKLKTSDEFAFKSQEQVMHFVQDICTNKIRPKLPQLFHDIPDIPLTLKPTPANQANAPGGFYMAGTFDKSRPGIYYVNGNNLSACKKYEFMALSLHEGEPGHHFQFSSTPLNIPSFRQYVEDAKYYMVPGRFPMHTAYQEGWGLYCEALGIELGLYTDNYSLFGRYSMEMLRAGRLVVDTGLHAMGWSQEKAVKYLVENTLAEEVTITNEVNRYITWPGQACAYKVGEIKLWKLRHRAEKELGEVFDVRDYHAAVLKTGPVALTFLETAVEEYIQSKKECSGTKKQKV